MSGKRSSWRLPRCFSSRTDMRTYFRYGAYSGMTKRCTSSMSLRSSRLNYQYHLHHPHIPSTSNNRPSRTSQLSTTLKASHGSQPTGASIYKSSPIWIPRSKTSRSWETRISSGCSSIATWVNSWISTSTYSRSTASKLSTSSLIIYYCRLAAS